MSFQTTMARSILLLGRTGIVVEDAKTRLNDPDLEVYGGTSIDDVRTVFSNHRIDHVFMGAGIELEKRLEIVREVFQLSETASVHMKDRASGPKGFLSFVEAILAGIKRTAV
jgi:hypothetical protein